MGKIVATENMTLDGVVQDPGGNEGLRHGGWFLEFGGQDLEEWSKIALDDARSAEAMLMGRRTDEWFAMVWGPRTGEHADRLNSLPKYVVSSTTTEPKWSNSTVLRGDVVTEVTKLKQKIGGNINVPASRQLVHTLIEHNLVDELRLTIFPVVLGSGGRLFSESSDKKPMHLVSAQTVGNLVRVIYQFV
jgi:dihydrofolate reductase